MRENFIRDEIIDVIINVDDVELEYEIIENGSKKGKRKLVYKRGF